MIIHDQCEQNSLEWLMLRAGVVTASEMDNILTPEFKVRTGEMRRTYLCRKLAERWIGGPLPGFMTLDMENGQILEEECLPYYAVERNEEVTRVAFIASDDGQVGCSPDGLLGESGGIEAKCPLAQTHIKYLLANECPKDYIVQVHSQLYVTGRPWWNFVSYHRGLPMLVVRVERDEEIISKIESAVADFLFDLNGCMERLCDINGGPPKRRIIKPPTQPQPSEMPS